MALAENVQPYLDKMMSNPFVVFRSDIFTLVSVLVLTFLVLKYENRASRFLVRLQKWLLNKISNPQSVMILLLLAGAGILISQLWGTGITPGDDSYIAVDRFRTGSIWNGSRSQAFQQGRFYYFITYTMSQWTYLAGSFAVLNSIKILVNVFIAVYFYKFVREWLGFETAAFSCLAGFMLFDTYGEAVSPFFSWPLMYGLGFGIQVFSFWLYVRACKQEKSLYLAYFFYLLGLIYYELMIFYSLGYILLYFYFFGSQIKARGWMPWLKTAFIKNFGLVLVLAIYFTIYLSFRHLYPSTYEGSSALTLSSPDRILKTIVGFSLGGVALSLLSMNSDDLWRSIPFTFITIFGFWLLFRRIAESSLKAPAFLEKSRVKWLLLGVGFFVFSPNFLYGFIEKYRIWVTNSAYYVPTFNSGFAINIFLGILIYYIWQFYVSDERKSKRFVKCFLAIAVILTFANISRASRYHLESRLHALRWPLIRAALSELDQRESKFNAFCTTTFILSPEDSYEYWAWYLSDILKRKITFTSTRPDSGNVKASHNQVPCDLNIDYKYDRRTRRSRIDVKNVDSTVHIHKEFSL